MNRLYFYRSLITRLRQYLISKSGTNPVTLTNAIEDKLLQGFSITGNSYQFNAGGKNLFNIATAAQYSGLATLEVKAEEQGCIVSQSGSGTWVSANILIDNSNYLIGKTITVSADVVPLGGDSCLRVMWMKHDNPVTGTMDIISNYVAYDDPKTLCVATGTVTAPPTSDSKLCLMLYSSASTGYENNITTFTDIQIELGAVKTDYEQYYPLSVQHPSPIQTTELKKSSNLLHTDYFNEAKTANGITIQYLPDEDCFLLNGTSTANVSISDTAFLIPNANNQPINISAFYVSGSITAKGVYAVAYIGKQDDSSATSRINFMSTDLQQNNTSSTKICDKEYVKDFWFYITTGFTFDNYKVKISVTKLENNLCDTVPFVSPATNPNNGITFTNNGDGSITFNGTCTGPQSQYFLYSTGTNLPADKTKQYFCHSISSSAGSASTYYFDYQMYLGATFVNDVKDYGNGVTIPANTYNYNNLRVKIYVNNGVTVDNVTVRPQIFEIPTNYEPYNKYGLEIKQEKNILDLYNASNAQYMTVTEQSENKVVATANNSSNNSPVLRLFNQSIPAGSYVLSYTVNIENTPQLSSSATTDRRNQLLVFANGSFKTQSSAIAVDGAYSNTIKFTLSSASTVILNWYRSASDNSTVAEDTTYKVTFTNVQLEQGTEASTYTPYQPPKYSHIWIDKPLLGKTDILTYDGTNLKIVNKEFKINLKDDVVWSYIEPTESGSIGTIQGVVNLSAALYPTLLSNTSQSYLCTHYDSSFFDISRKHTEGISTLRNTVLTFNGLQTDYDSFMEVINTGNVEMLIKYVNNLVAEQRQFTKTITSSSYIDLQPLSAGNNTLTVTNEISPTSCQYKYYSSKEN